MKRELILSPAYREFAENAGSRVREKPALCDKHTGERNSASS